MLPHCLESRTSIHVSAGDEWRSSRVISTYFRGWNLHKVTRASGSFWLNVHAEKPSTRHWTSYYYYYYNYYYYSLTPTGGKKSDLTWDIRGIRLLAKWEKQTDVCFTFHEGTFQKAARTSGLVSLTTTFISSMAFTTLKSYNFGFMLVLIILWKQLHASPKRQTLLVLRVISCIKQEDVVEMDVQYIEISTALNTISHRSSEKPTSICKTKKTKTHSSQATFAQTPNCGMFISI